MMNNTIKGIYIHIPFCHHICYYCDFSKVLYNSKLADDYLDSLNQEMSQAKINSTDVETIYIGGGTPSSLSIKQLKKLFSFVDFEQYPNLKEFTIELNPEQINNDLILLLKESGINRVSLGVQTFNEKILSSLNRHHTKDNVFDAITLLRLNGIENISIDLMYGFNNQTLDDIKYDLMLLNKLEIKHVAVYSLILEEGCVFHNIKYKTNELEDDFGEYINQYLIENLDFEHYEVSNYAKEKQYSKHNLLYWSNEHYYGFGLGACGYVDNYRYYNTKSITNYLKNILNRQYEYYNSLEELLVDEVVVSFRKYNGIDLNIFTEKYSLCFTKYFEHAIIKNINKVFIKDNFLYFTKQGKLFLNDIIIDFINEIEE